MDSRYFTSTAPEPHRGLTGKLMKQFPETKKISGRNPWTALIIVAVVAVQVGVAIALQDAPWWLVITLAWTFGTLIQNTFIALVHECAHSLIFKNPNWNRIAACVVNLPMIVPSAILFQKFHMLHHLYQGQLDGDSDIPRPLEVKLVGKSWWRKIIWLLIYPLIQSLRTFAITKGGKAFDIWTITNWITCFAFTGFIIYAFGMHSFTYLMVSFWLGFGLSISGGRLIQEHFIVAYPQETYDYYGPLSLVALHVGHHNEHHDFPFASWEKLPKIRKAAAPYYNSLVAHTSWTKLMFKFIFDPTMGVQSRVIREKAIPEKTTPSEVAQAESLLANFSARPTETTFVSL